MSLDALETLSKFTSPLLIPLPPSPPPKISIPSRKPSGWVSVAPRFPSGRFAWFNKERRVSGVDKEEKDKLGDQEERTDQDAQGELRGETEGVEMVDGSSDPKVSISAVDTPPRVSTSISHNDINSPIPTPSRRMPSLGTAHRSTSIQYRGTVPSQGRRTISGAMQYALLPPSPPPSSSPPSLDHLDPIIFPISSSSPHRYPPAPSTSSPRSEQIYTPLPNTEFSILPHIHNSDDSDVNSTHGSESDIYQVDNLIETGDISFQSVSEADTAEEEEDDRVGEVLAEREADEEWMGYVRGQLNALFPDFFQESQGLGEENGFADPIRIGGQSGDSVPVPGVLGQIGELRDEIERLRDVVGELKEKESEKAIIPSLTTVGNDRAKKMLFSNADLVVDLIRALDARVHPGPEEKGIEDLLSRDSLVELVERVKSI